MTESGLGDFSHYCPAGSLQGDMAAQEAKPSKTRSKTAWFSRLTKPSSVPLSVDESCAASHNTPGHDPAAVDPSEKRKRRKPRSENRNSLPVEVSLRKLPPDSAGEPRHETDRDHDGKRFSSPIDSPMLRLMTLQKELEALKGCVSRRRTIFSPSHSPDLDFLEDPIEEPRPPPLVVDKPFNILSSSTETVVFPLEEYSVQVEPFYDSAHSSDGSSSSSGHGESHDQSPPLKKQGSYEYDHLEEEEEEEEEKDENKGDGDNAHLPRRRRNDGYFVAVQFSEESNKEIKTSTLATQSDTNIPSRKDSIISVPEEHGKTHSSYFTLQPHKNSPTVATRLSSSIPGRLDSNTLPDILPPSHIGTKWKNSSSSASELLLPNEKEACHCPSCCSCGSSQRRLSSDGFDPAHRRQSSCDFSPAASAQQLCPLKRYGTSPSRRKTYSISPLVRNKIERVASDGHHGRHYLEDNDLCIEPDAQSLWSIQSHFSVQSSVTVSSLSCCDRHHSSYNNGVDVNVFKQRMDLISQWFGEFSDQQRNSLLHRIIEQCNCSQMHLLSLHMEPILHQSCPHNCQDLLSWLPPGIALRILSFLDPVSLCRVSQVSSSWYTLANDKNLWKQMCMCPTWQLSPAGLAKLTINFTDSDGSMQWKPMFIEMFRLRRNWLKGYCTVRTFEGHTQGISCVQFDDTRIVSGSWDKTIKVWNRRTNTAWAALTLAGHSGTVRCLHLHGNRLVSGSSDRTIKVWDLATNNVGWVGAACRATMIGHLHTVRCLQADDNKVLSGSYDHTVKIWDLKSGQCTMTLRGHTDAVLCLQFDKTKVISGSKDTTIKLWTLNDGQCQLTLHGHEGAVTCLQFDDSRIISGALDRLIKIWDLNTGQCLHTMDWIKSEGHTGVVRHLQADSWKIVSAADDKTLKVWSVRSGERLLTLKSHTDGVTCLQFNDQVIVSGSYDKSVKLWDFSVC